MGLSYDYASSILLCAEDNSLLCFEEMVEEEEEAHGLVCREAGAEFYEDFFMGFPIQTADCMELIIKKEVDFLPREDYKKRLVCGYLDLSIRRDAIDWIWKVNAHYNFGPLTAYLSVNYMDRFLSEYEIPKEKAWTTQLLAVACLSLAAKMEETQVPLSLDLQVGEAKYVFEPKTIQRMELLVLSTLNWRTQAVTPFSFLDYFLHKFNDDNLPTKSLLSRSAQFILSTVRGIEFIGFKPSEIASAVAISALGEIRAFDIEKAVNCCNLVDKERVLRYYEKIQEMIKMGNETSNATNASRITYNVPQSPNGVFEVSYLSYESDDANLNLKDNSPHSKRRKLSKPCMS